MQDNEPYIITKKRTVRKVYWGRIVAVTVVLSLIAVGVILWFSRTAGKITVDAREFWFVSMGEYSELSEASSRAEAVVNSGGAGYLHGDEKYNVAASCYANKSDAVSVKERLTGEGETASVFSVSCPKIAIDKPKKNATLLKDLLARPAALFDELYSISVKTDTKEISEAAAQYAALKMSVACEEYARECKALDAAASDYLSALFTSVGASLDVLARSDGNIPQAVKYALCETAVKICKETNEFANKLKNMS